MKTALLVTALLAATIGSCFAQQAEIRGGISGTVIDVETRQPLPSVHVWLEGTGFGASTDIHGAYTIRNIPVGRYSLTVSMIGYETVSRTEIVVIPKRSTIVNVGLKQSYIKMEEVVVRPEYFQPQDGKGNTSLTSISRKEIRRTSGIPDVFRRLQSVAGVGRSADNSPALMVRGGAPDENLTIIENVEIQSPFHFSSLSGGMAEGISIIQPNIVGNVMFLTGGFNSRFGDKLSSVTEIQLLQPSVDRINVDVTLDISGFGTNVGGPVSDNASVMISGRRSIYDLMMQIRGKEYSPRTTDLHAKSIYRPGNDHTLTFYGMYVQDELERTKDEDDLGLDDELKYRTISKQMSAAGVTWTWLFSTKGYLTVTPYVNTNVWDMTEGRQQDINERTQENDEHYYGVKAFASWRFNHRHRVMGGTELKFINTAYLKWSGEDTLRTGVVQSPRTLSFGPERAVKTAAFLHYYYSPIEWIHINTGVRTDHFDFTDETVVSPRVGLQLQACENLRINAAYGLFSQFPPFYRIFLNDRNSELKTGSATHYIAGLEYLLDADLQVKVEGFYKDIHDLAVADTDTSTLYTSTGTGYAHGIECTLTQKLSRDLYLLLSYTYSKSMRRDDADKIEYPYDYDSPHTANLMATYRLGKWWDISVTCRYSTGMPLTPYDLSTRRQINNTWYCDKGEKNSLRLPDYVRLDVRIDRRFIFSSYSITTFLEIWNLTNNENVISYNYSDDFLTKEAVTLFTLMPMAGVTIEF